MKNDRSKYFEIIKTMPPLYHSLPNREFNIADSEVAKWITGQPEVLNAFITKILNTSKTATPLVTYDPDTGKWRGADYGT